MRIRALDLLFLLEIKSSRALNVMRLVYFRKTLLARVVGLPFQHPE